MRRYLLTIEYDGTNYYGWQLQPGLPSITGVLQKTFYKTFKHHTIITGASRTDAGVHALGQIATFTSNLAITPYKLLGGWNNALPRDIVIRSIDTVDISHNIFNDIIRKVYTYQIFLKRPSPLTERFGWYHPKAIDQEKLYQTLQQVVGCHDFTALCAADAPDPDKIRLIESITVSYNHEQSSIIISVAGPRFLRHMIRRIVGGSIKIASDPTLSVDYIQQVLATRNPNNQLPTAPAQGLLLDHITYQDRYD